MASDAMREAFESEMRCEEEWGHRSLSRSKNGDYTNRWTAFAWSVWQAARRAPAPEVAGSSDSLMPVIGYANVIDGKMQSGRPDALGYEDSAVVLQSDALKAIEEALEKAAVIAERSTAKRRFAKAGVNSQTMEPCGIAQAIRSLKESP